MTYNPRVGFLTRPLPDVIRQESIAVLLAARRAEYLARNPEWINDPSDPTSEVINAVADVEYRVMQRFNTGAIQLSAATADGSNLDTLAGNIGLLRLADEADDTLRARIAAHLLSANIATQPALLAACLARPGIIDADAPRPENGQDFQVYVRTDPEVSTAVADLTTWLNDDDRALAGWSYSVAESGVTRMYGSVAVRYNSTHVPIDTLRPAVTRAVLAYLASARISAAVHTAQMVVAAINAGALNATAQLGLAANALAGNDLPAVVGSRYHLQNDADCAITFTDVI